MYFMSLLVNKHCLFFQTLYFAGRGEVGRAEVYLIDPLQSNLLLTKFSLFLSLLLFALNDKKFNKSQQTKGTV